MTTPIKALPSLFKGITFRSRTEARWAVFFEAIGWNWTHEKEGFDLSGEWYLPDFYLADFPMWFEVKPDETDGSEQDVFKKLCKETKTPGIIAYGSPSPRQCNLLRVSDEGQIIGKYMFLSDRRNDGEYWLSNDDYGCFSIGPVDGPDHGRWPIMGDNLKASFGIARDEKFGT